MSKRNTFFIDLYHVISLGTEETSDIRWIKRGFSNNFFYSSERINIEQKKKKKGEKGEDNTFKKISRAEHGPKHRVCHVFILRNSGLCTQREEGKNERQKEAAWQALFPNWKIASPARAAARRVEKQQGGGVR